jgi:acylpyruvate hydrolase
VDFEGELAVIIGRRGRRIREDDAPHHILGYTVANDITMRDYQAKSHQWLQGKAWDASTPLGPYVVPHVQMNNSTGIRTRRNGVTVQESDLSQLIFTIPTLVALISAFTTLQPGDIILTGTRGGTGNSEVPKRFLTAGDQVTVELAELAPSTTPSSPRRRQSESHL